MKRAVCLILSLVLMISCFPVQPAAAQEQTTTQVLPEDLISLEQDPTTEPGEAMPSEPKETTAAESVPQETLPEETAPEETTLEETLPAEYRPTKGTTTSGSIGDCRWTLDGTVLTISGTGSMGGYYLSNATLPWGKAITKVIIEPGVTEIGTNVFNYCTKLTEVVLPATVNQIKGGAFNNCTAIQKVSITDLGAWCQLTFDTQDSNPLYCGGKLYLDGALLTDAVIPQGVTQIADYAFYNMSSLKSVTIPNTVEEIGYAAFYGCSGLTEMKLPEGLKIIDSGAFSGCNGLTEIVVPDSVTSIGGAAFSGCSGLTSMTLPFVGLGEAGYNSSHGCFGAIFGTTSYTGGIKTSQSYYYYYIPSGLTSVTVTGGELSEGAFTGSSMLKEIQLPNTITEIPNEAFFNCTGLKTVLIPDSVTTIGADAFRQCYGLEEITIPDGVTTLGANAFSHCTSLQKVILGDGLENAPEVVFPNCTALQYNQFDNGLYLGSTSNPYLMLMEASAEDITTCQIHPDTQFIASKAFYYHNTLTQITIPDQVKQIGADAFFSCARLTEASLGAGVKTVEDDAFAFCSKLTRIVIPDAVEALGRRAFQGCSALTEVTLGQGIKSIQEEAFGDCYSLRSIAIPDNVETIGNKAFSGCDKLTEVALGAGITEIPYGMFYECTALTEITIPANITKIGASAFGKCTQLSRVSLPDSITYIDTSAFSGCDNLVYTTYDNALYMGNEANPYVMLVKVISTDITASNIHPKTRVIAASAFSGCCAMTQLDLPQGLTSIGEQAFANCSSLTQVVIPASVTSVGAGAFSGCSSITSMTIPFIGSTPDSKDAFGVIFGITSYTGGVAVDQSLQSNSAQTYYLPSLLKSVTVTGGEVKDYAFYNCSMLTSIQLPETATQIGNRALANCTGLTEISIPASVTELGVMALAGNTGLKNIVIPDSVTRIEDHVLNGCTNLESLTIPFVGRSRNETAAMYHVLGHIFGSTSYTGSQAVTQANRVHYIPVSLHSVTVTGGEIKVGAFSGCTGLTEVHLSESITAIGNSAFRGCTALTTVTMPRVKTIEDYGFYQCTALTEIALPESLEQLGQMSFSGCTGLKQAILPDQLLCVGAMAFEGCTALTDVTLGAQLTKIDAYAFGNCTALTSITLPENLVWIGESAFEGCSKLASVNIPQGVTQISDSAFRSCGLTSLEIPDTVTQIGSYAFAHCSKLAELTMGSGVVSMGEYAFYGCNGIKNLYISDPNAWCGVEFGKYAWTRQAATHVLDGEGNEITKLVLDSSVTNIPEYAFYGCTSLTELVIPDTVETVGGSAFGGCSNLQSVTLPFMGSNRQDTRQLLGYLFGTSSYTGGVSTRQYYSASSYMTYYIPATLKTVTVTGDQIGYGAFYNCANLTQINLPDGLETVGEAAFYGCTGLNYNLYGNGKYMGTESNPYLCLVAASATDITECQIHPATKLIGYRAFEACSKLNAVRIPDGVVRIDTYAFYNCTAMTDLYLGAGVENFASGMVYGCYNLQRIEVSEGNETLCSVNGIVYDRQTMTQVCKPSGHRYILQIVFTYTNGQTAQPTVEMRLRSGVSYSNAIPEIVGYSTAQYEVTGKMPANDLVVNVVYYENAIVERGQCTSTLNWTMYEDGTLVFRGTGAMPNYTGGTAPWAKYAQQVKLVYLDPRVTSIGDYAFENCANMTYIDYGRSVTTIGIYAFAGCSALTSFSLPASVTQVAQGAFSGCSGLTNVVIPDNITAIGDDAFLGCSNLVQVTIGGNVTQIGSNAFANCPNLTQIYFRGAPAAVGSDVFGETAGKFVFYYSTISGWEEQIDSEGHWHGYTVFPYNAITGEEVDLDSLYIIKVVDKHNQPLGNASVTLGDQNTSSHANGLAYFDHKPTQAESLRIECSNHQDFIDEQFSTTSTQLMDVIEMTDKPSYIQGIRLNNRSIATSVQVLDSAKSEQVKIAVSGYSKYKVVKYELCQGSRVIATYVPETPVNENVGYTFTVSANAFEEGQTVLVRMYTSDGQSVASALNIDVVHLAVISETQIMDEFSNLSITIGLGGMGEYKVPFTVTGTEEEMVYVTVTGRTIRVGINLDLAEIFGDDDDDKDAPIGLIHKMVDNAMKNNIKDKTGVIFDLCGYIELEYLGDGEYYLKTTYVKVSVGVKIGFRAQASFYGIVGVYFEASVSAKGTLELKISRVTPEEGFQFEELNFSPEVGLRVEGGAYILWGAGSAGIYGELTIGFTLGIIPEFDIKTVYITGELGVTWSLLWGLFGDSHVIAGGDIYRWPEGYSKKEFETLLRQLQTDSSSYTVNDRAYLEERSDWQGSGEYLQTGIYGQVAPKTVTCGNTTMMLWLDDNAQRDLANFQTLYYSIYTDGAWSAPVALDDNGTFDCEFDVCTDGQKIYVIYTERTTAASGVETMDASDMESLMAFANGVEVMVSVYENGSFSKPKALTDNQICETSPTISISGGKLTAAWLESDNVGADAVGAGNTLRTVCLENGVWGKPTTTVSGSNAVGSMTMVTLQDQSCAAYTVDADGSGMTKDDQVLLLKDAQGEVHHLDTGSISRVDAAEVDGDTVLTWNKEGMVYMLTRADAAAVRLTPEGMAVSEHQLLAVDGQTLLLYVNDDRVYGLYLDETGPLTQGVVMASSQGSISGFSATSRKGSVHAVFTETFAEIIDSTMHTQSHLRNIVLEFRTDIAVQNPDYQILDVRPLTELTVDVDVTNTGNETVDSLYVELTDPQGKLVYTTQYAVALTSGTTQNCQIALVMPQSITAGEYTLHLLPCRGMTQLTDANTSDNSIKLTLAYADLEIQAEQKIIGEKNFIAMTVENQGNITTHAVIEVYAPDRSGRQIATLDTSKQLDPQPIAPGQSVQFFIDIHALTTQADSLVTCIVTADFADPVSLNNTDTVKLLHLQSDGFVADPYKAVANPELAVNYGAFDKYVPQDITVQINACKEEFSGIEGLIRGTDYTINYKTGVVTLMQSYLNSLETGNYTLVFQFAYDNAASATRAYNLAVTDSTPIQLSGSIAISGEPVVGSTLSADLSGLSYENANVTYLWTVGGVTVSTEKTYTVVPADNEKTLVLTVTGYDGFAGSFTQEAQITLAQVDAPVAPVTGKVEATAITVVGMNGAEYSMDGKTWQASPVFTGLQPNTTYTIYARFAQTDSSFASDASTATVTTPKHARQMGKPTRFETVGAVVHFGDALPTDGIGDGQITYGYSLMNDPATVTVWSAEGVLPQVDTPTTYYVFARITGSDAYEDAVSLGSQVQAHVHQYKDTVVKPTIEAEGYTEHTCVCGDSYKDSFVDKLTYIVGDVNRDGRVNTQDRILLARYLAKWIGYDAERIDLAAADVNGDGRVNTQDRIILARYLAKWIGYEELPANR